MANPRELKGSPVLPQIFQLLQVLHQRLLPPCPTPFQPPQKGETMEMGEAEAEALKTLKDLITLAPVLVFLDDSQMY